MLNRETGGRPIDSNPVFYYPLSGWCSTVNRSREGYLGYAPDEDNLPGREQKDCRSHGQAGIDILPWILVLSIEDVHAGVPYGQERRLMGKDDHDIGLASQGSPGSCSLATSLLFEMRVPSPLMKESTYCGSVHLHVYRLQITAWKHSPLKIPAAAYLCPKNCARAVYRPSAALSAD